jgi:hypothetical protein
MLFLTIVAAVFAAFVFLLARRGRREALRDVARLGA